MVRGVPLEKNSRKLSGATEFEGSRDGAANSEEPSAFHK